MPAEQNSKQTTAVTLDQERLDSGSGHFVPVAIPGKLDQSKNLKADLEAYDIPALLEEQAAEMDAEALGGVPVLVPEGIFERASEIVGLIELNALDDDDFDVEEEEEEFEGLEEDEEDEDEDEEEWDDEELEDEEEEEEEEKEGEEFDVENLDELDEDEDVDKKKP
ncbi:MAG: hypothetical protein WC975_09520 [Phycisphaerae bacterium]